MRNRDRLQFILLLSLFILTLNLPFKASAGEGGLEGLEIAPEGLANVPWDKSLSDVRSHLCNRALFREGSFATFHGMMTTGLVYKSGRLLFTNPQAQHGLTKFFKRRLLPVFLLLWASGHSYQGYSNAQTGFALDRLCTMPTEEIRHVLERGLLYDYLEPGGVFISILVDQMGMEQVRDMLRAILREDYLTLQNIVDGAAEHRPGPFEQERRPIEMPVLPGEDG